MTRIQVKYGIIDRIRIQCARHLLSLVIAGVVRIESLLVKHIKFVGLPTHGFAHEASSNDN